MNRKMLECPLMGKKIKDETCFDISMYAEGLSPINFIPKELQEREDDIKEICLKCKNHRYD